MKNKVKSHDHKNGYTRNITYFLQNFIHNRIKKVIKFLGGDIIYNYTIFKPIDLFNN